MFEIVVSLQAINSSSKSNVKTLKSNSRSKRPSTILSSLAKTIKNLSRKISKFL
ncbi:hypothetical protein Scep_013093 [Stephania cephalantha]|uniref:Uncharacterized protein n=1 Tax=Stephania cephalantha TaxID=152367 RepID=A0AAP0JH71_9MAGN